MKALVLWADHRSTNLGVQALADGSAAMLEAAWPGIEVSLQSYGTGTSPVPFNSKALLGVDIRGSRVISEWLRSFDVVVDTGAGDSFTDIYGLRRLAEMSSIRNAVVRAGVPLVMGAQTFGPFNTAIGRNLGRRSVQGAKLLVARESTSGRYARSGLRRHAVLGTDVAFAIPQSAVQKSREILVNVSGLLWQENHHVDHLEYRRLVLELMRRLIDSGRSVGLLSHVIDSELADNDRIAIEATATALGGNVELHSPANLADVRQIIASSQLVVGARMHACLNALSQGIPAVPLAYSRKFAPLMSDLQWEPSLDLRTDSAIVDKTLRWVSVLLSENGPSAVAVRERALAKNALVVSSLQRAA